MIQDFMIFIGILKESHLKFFISFYIWIIIYEEVIKNACKAKVLNFIALGLILSENQYF